jgi:fermentation-respiration switch protein FrsA (DUF1100 family)
MHVLLKFAIGALIAYLAFCCLLFLTQRQIIFPRNQIGYLPGYPKNVTGLEKIWLNSKCGRFETWFLPPTLNGSSRPAPAVIFAHGNAELIDFWPAELQPITHMGLGVLLVEYPGYGRSEGKPSQKSITEAFTTAYDMLVARKDVDSSRIVLFGRSVGGGAVCSLASQRPSAALILQSSFTSVRSIASKYFVPGFLVLDPFDNLSVVKNYRHPILIIHGRRDEIIPYLHGVSLHKAAKKGNLITYECGHNDCPPDYDRYWTDIKGFLKAAEIL